jgi:hypothetical protein
VFEQVVDGLETLLSIPPRDPSQPQSPAVRLNSITIREE